MKAVRIAGKTLELGKRVGRGGEGDVYVLAADPNRAIKIYKEALRPSRKEKIDAMVKLGLASTTNLVAFPAEVVLDTTGKFVGFAMRLVAKYRPIHELYSPKSRIQHFPGKDYRFLIRAARNLAVAVAKVHQTGCVIGDFNHSGVLVSDDATIALIDADSFQISAAGRLYPCLVGVADFTPPELHGVDLAKTPRTQAHDNFGLAVAIFHLLAMGRHPYAGRHQGGDISLGDAIAQHRFAFSVTRQSETRCTPPPGSVQLGDFPSQIGAALEAAFGRTASARPDAKSWIALLGELENALTKCSAVPTHFYPSVTGKCVWCRVVAQTGVDMFPEVLSQGSWTSASLANFDLDKLAAQFRSIRLPTLEELLPRWNGDVATSDKARKAQHKQTWSKFVGAIAIASAVATFWFVPAVWFLWLGLGGYGLTKILGAGIDTEPFIRSYEQAQDQLLRAESTFGDRVGHTEMQSLHQQFEGWIIAYRSIEPDLAKALGNLKSTRESRQREAYLDRFPLRRASIPGIGPAKIATLASFGIETATDIKKGAVLRVPGFGDVLAQTLIEWRKRLESRFRFDSTPNQADAQAEAALRAAAGKQRQELQGKMVSAAANLAQAPARLKSGAAGGNDQLRHLQEIRASAKHDLEVLNIPAPSPRLSAAPTQTRANLPNSTARRASNFSSRTSARTPSPPASVTAYSCPKCGSRMVKRTARRGYNAGSQFWGCSRYPSCKGTRPA